MNDFDIAKSLSLNKCPVSDLWWSEKMAGFESGAPDNLGIAYINPLMEFLDDLARFLDDSSRTYGDIKVEKIMVASVAEIWFEDRVIELKRELRKIVPEHPRYGWEEMQFSSEGDPGYEIWQKINFCLDAKVKWSKFRSYNSHA